MVCVAATSAAALANMFAQPQAQGKTTIGYKWSNLTIVYNPSYRTNQRAYTIRDKASSGQLVGSVMDANPFLFSDAAVTRFRQLNVANAG